MLTIGGPAGTNPAPYKGVAEIHNNLEKTRTESFKSKFINTVLKMKGVSMIQRIFERQNIHGGIRKNMNTGLSLPFSHWPNPINHSTGVSHPKSRNYGPTSVTIPAKRGKHLKIRRSSSQHSQREIPVPSVAKETVHFARSSSILIPINLPYLGTIRNGTELSIRWTFHPR